jgi:hypothetical protein
MRTIKMTTGARVPLDGDLLTMLETLYKELTAKRELVRTFEDTVREIQTVIDQMNEEERRQYLSESLFLNFVSYENERLAAYLKRKLAPAQESKVKTAKTNGKRPKAAVKKARTHSREKAKGTR